MSGPEDGWPAAAREAVKQQLRGWMENPRTADEAAAQAADDVFLALAPFVAAREAAAELRGRRDGCALLPELPLEALPPPDGSDALARIRAEAYREGMEAAAAIAKDVCDDVKRRTETPYRRAREDRHLSEECHQEGRWHGAHDCQEKIDERIRAAAEVKP